MFVCRNLFFNVVKLFPVSYISNSFKIISEIDKLMYDVCFKKIGSIITPEKLITYYCIIETTNTHDLFPV